MHTSSFPATCNGFPALHRRNFLNIAGSALAFSVAAQLVPGETSAQASENIDASRPVELPPLHHPSEGQPAPLDAHGQPEKRIGFAIAGPGHLDLEELMPAFGQCNHARPVALVSGDASKAKKVAAQYGVPLKNIYNYESFDSTKNNKDIQVVYIVLPNNMHEEYTIRAARAGKYVLCKKPLATSADAAKRMADACAASNVKLMTAYRIQYAAKNNLMKDQRSVQGNYRKKFILINTILFTINK